MANITNPDHYPDKCPHFNEDNDTCYSYDRFTARVQTQRNYTFVLAESTGNTVLTACDEKNDYTHCPTYFALTKTEQSQKPITIVAEIMKLDTNNLDQIDASQNFKIKLEELLRQLENGTIKTDSLHELFWRRIEEFQNLGRTGGIYNSYLITDLFKKILNLKP